MVAPTTLIPENTVPVPWTAQYLCPDMVITFTQNMISYTGTVTKACYDTASNVIAVELRVHTELMRYGCEPTYLDTTFHPLCAVIEHVPGPVTVPAAVPGMQEDVQSPELTAATAALNEYWESHPPKSWPRTRNAAEAAAQRTARLRQMALTVLASQEQKSSKAQG